MTAAVDHDRRDVEREIVWVPLLALIALLLIACSGDHHDGGRW